MSTQYGLFALCIFCLSACSTIEFVNGPKMDETVVRDKWHHLGVNGLIEFSAPLNLEYFCDDKQWDSVIIEHSLANYMATLSAPGFGVYSPWTITYACREAID